MRDEGSLRMKDLRYVDVTGRHCTEVILGMESRMRASGLGSLWTDVLPGVHSIRQ